MNDKSLIEILKNKDKFRTQLSNNREQLQKVEKISSNDLFFLHIEELTFEDKSPRKEALENVIASIRIDGISFVYLLLGDEQGVSFYFGIAKDKKYKKELVLDVDDIGRDILKPSIEGNFRGSKVRDISKEKKTLLSKIKSMKRFAKIDGVATINEDSEDFQGMDRVVDIMMGDKFGLMVIADPLSIDEIQEIENSLYTVYNKLSPLAKLSVQESEGVTKTNGSSKGESSSKTEGENKGVSESESKNSGVSTSASKGESSGSSDSTNSSKSESVNQGDSYTVSFNTGSSNSLTVGRNSGTNESIAKNNGTTKSREYADKVVNEWMSYIDEVLTQRMEYGRNKGLFHTGIYIFADTKGTVLKLGNTISSLFCGTIENKAPLKIVDLAKYEIEAIKNFQLPVRIKSLNKNEEQASLLFSQNNIKIANWISTAELSVIASLPQKEVVGLSLKEEVEFGLNIKKQNIKKENKLLLGNLVKSGHILNLKIALDKEHLNKHTFITGVTGSGKTTTCQRVLQSANMPFMVIEPAKTEYRILTKNYDDILIFTLGDESIAPFRINPFEFFKGENITSRVDMIKANIEAAFDMEAAIPQIIESALYQCYEKKGWDIATSTNAKYKNPFADGVYAFPTFSELIQESEVIVKEHGFDDRLKNDYIGSIKARLQGLIVGAKGFMLDTPRSIDFKDLIEKNVIIELEEIKNGAEKSLIMGFILINLNEAIKQKHTEYKKQNKEFQHITLIEEAHRLLSKFTAGDNPSKKLGVETFADMLAEVRKYGESLIIVDQIPNKLTPEVLKNTNTKIVHKLFANDDKEAIGNTMALDDEQKKFLSSLEVGRAIVSNQDFAKPIQVQIKELDDISTTTSKIVDTKDIRNIVLEYYKENYKRGVIVGLELLEKEPTKEELDKILKYNLSHIQKEWIKLCQIGKMTKFGIDLKSLLTQKGLDKDLEFLKMILIKTLYKDRTTDVKEWLEKNLVDFLDNVVRNNKNEFNRIEKAYLKIGG